MNLLSYLLATLFVKITIALMLSFSTKTSLYYLSIQGQLTPKAFNETVSMKFTLMVMFTIILFFLYSQQY